MGWASLDHPRHPTRIGGTPSPTRHSRGGVTARGEGEEPPYAMPLLSGSSSRPLSRERDTHCGHPLLVSEFVFSSRLLVLLWGQSSADNISIRSLYHRTIRTRACWFTLGSRPVRTSVPIAATVSMAHTAHGHGSVGC